MILGFSICNLVKTSFLSCSEQIRIAPMPQLNVLNISSLLIPPIKKMCEKVLNKFMH